MQQAVLQLETLTCPSCLQKIENALKSLKGVDKDSIEVLFNSSRARLNFDPEIISITDLEAVIVKLGYEVLKTRVR